MARSQILKALFSLGSWIGSLLWEHRVEVFLCLVFLFFFFTEFVALPLVGLLLATLFFCWRGEYKRIFILWSLFCTVWYLVFVALMVGFDGLIIFGLVTPSDGEIIKFFIDGDIEEIVMLLFCFETKNLYQYLLRYDNTVFCYFVGNTFLIFFFLCGAIGRPIFIPSIYKGFFALISFISKIWGG